jgi:hypothetical protein
VHKTALLSILGLILSTELGAEWVTDPDTPKNERIRAMQNCSLRFRRFRLFEASNNGSLAERRE